jgi:ActR/RegA family two-component response regulator
VPKTREIKTITIVSNSSELIVQTLADIIPSEFDVKTLRYSSINWDEAAANSLLASSNCLIVDLMLDFQEFSKTTKQLRKLNSSAKIIVLDDYSSLAFLRQTNGLEWIDSSLNISDFPEQIESELKKKNAASINHLIEKVGDRIRNFSIE